MGDAGMSSPCHLLLGHTGQLVNDATPCLQEPLQLNLAQQSTLTK